MELSLREQSELLGKSSGFISCVKNTNLELFNYCTKDGKMFMVGYRELLTRYASVKSSLFLLECVDVILEYPASVAKKFGYKSVRQLAISVSKQIDKFDADDCKYSKLLHFVELMEEILRVNKILALTPDLV